MRIFQLSNIYNSIRTRISLFGLLKDKSVNVRLTFCTPYSNREIIRKIGLFEKTNTCFFILLKWSIATAVYEIDAFKYTCQAFWCKHWLSWYLPRTLLNHTPIANGLIKVDNWASWWFMIDVYCVEENWTISRHAYLLLIPALCLMHRAFESMWLQSRRLSPMHVHIHTAKSSLIRNFCCHVNSIVCSCVQHSAN